MGETGADPKKRKIGAGCKMRQCYELSLRTDGRRGLFYFCGITENQGESASDGKGPRLVLPYLDPN